MPLISVIIPVYNVEKYIEKSLDSVLDQSYNDFEIILVDDGSEDLSLEIARIYESKDTRVRVYSKKNGGLSSARNFGLSKVSGQYVTFLDSDDYIAKDYLKILYNSLIKYDSDIAIVGFSFDKLGAIESASKNDYFEEVLEPEKAIFSMYSHPCVSSIAFVTSWGKLYKKELFTNIQFPEGRLHEDEFTTYKLYMAAKSIIYTNEPLYFYRQRHGSIMSQKYSLSRLDVIDAFEERRELLKDSEILLNQTDRNLLKLLAYHRYFLKVNRYEKEYTIINKKYKKLFKVVFPKLSVREKIVSIIEKYFYFIKLLRKRKCN